MAVYTSSIDSDALRTTLQNNWCQETQMHWMFGSPKSVSEAHKHMLQRATASATIVIRLCMCKHHVNSLGCIALLVQHARSYWLDLLGVVTTYNDTSQHAGQVSVTQVLSSQAGNIVHKKLTVLILFSAFACAEVRISVQFSAVF